MDFTYKDIINKLKNKKQFSFSRWGDGEFNAVLGKPGQNCDQHSYFESLGKELLKILRQPQCYIMGLQPLAKRIQGKDIEALNLKINWVDADVFHNQSMDGGLSELLDVLKTRYVVYVAPKRMNIMGKYFDFKHVEVPLINCWTQKERILIDTEHELNRDVKDVVVLFSAGMPTNYFIDQLVVDYPTATLIDVGSLFDPYCGFETRKYHKTLKINE